MNKGHQGTRCVDQRIELISTDRIVISKYQRPISVRRAAKIAQEFDAAKLGLLVVSERPDGYYAILDGQHRLAALREKGMNSVLSIVLAGMTLQEEADYFRHQNDNRARIDAYDRYNASIVANDQIYLAVDKLLHDHDFAASRTSGPKQVMAVASLIQIATQHGLERLNTILSYVQATWPMDTNAVRRVFLAGLTEFAVRFGSQVSPEQFCARLRSRMPSEMLDEYHRRTNGRATIHNAFDRSMRYVLCGVLVDAYNKGLPGKSRMRLRLVWDMPPIECSERGLWQ